MEPEETFQTKLDALDEQYRNRDQAAIQNSTLLEPSRICQDLFLPLYFYEHFTGKNRISLFLEVASSVGTLTHPIRGFVDEVYSFDISEGAIEISRERNGDIKGITTFVGDGVNPLTSKELEGKNFDFIYIREFHPYTRNYFENLEEAKKEQKRSLSDYFSILRPGGLVLVLQANVAAQAFDPNGETIPDNAEVLISHLDPRIFSPLLQLFKRRIKLAAFLTKALQLILHLKGHPTHITLLKKK